MGLCFSGPGQFATTFAAHQIDAGMIMSKSRPVAIQGDPVQEGRRERPRYVSLTGMPCA